MNGCRTPSALALVGRAGRERWPAVWALLVKAPSEGQLAGSIGATRHCISLDQAANIRPRGLGLPEARSTAAHRAGAPTLWRSLPHRQLEWSELAEGGLPYLALVQVISSGRATIGVWRELGESCRVCLGPALGMKGRVPVAAGREPAPERPGLEAGTCRS